MHFTYNYALFIWSPRVGYLGCSQLSAIDRLQRVYLALLTIFYTLDSRFELPLS